MHSKGLSELVYITQVQVGCMRQQARMLNIGYYYLSVRNDTAHVCCLVLNWCWELSSLHVQSQSNVKWVMLHGCRIIFRVKRVPQKLHG